GEFVEGQMSQDFEDAVWVADLETPPSAFFKTQFGYHLIWVHSVTLPDDNGGRTKI
ncbi:MAG: peptidylprolyl isomerase, partial [Poseidonia sp.]